MSAKMSLKESDPLRCDLCGYRSDGSFADRFGHLRRSHPRYARGLLLRMAAPFVFIAVLGVLALVRAPQVVYLPALVVCFGVMIWGKQQSRVERTRAGAPATLGVRRLLREGGLRVALFIPVVVVIILLLNRL